MRTVLSVEMREGSEAQEELGTISAGTSVSHGQNTLASVLMNEVLVLKFVAIDRLSSSSVSASEISSLSHEARDDSVPDAALEVKRLALLSNTLLSSAESTEVL